MVASMGIESTHGEYDRAAAEWARARDVLAGEDAVKAAGARYLPRLDSQSEEEYEAYKARASFFGATARTVEEYLDLVFRRGPGVSLGSCTGLGAFVANCDRWGTGFVSYARRVVSEVLGVGRAGTLVLQDSGRPVVSFWRAEDVLNWEVERVGGRTVLVLLVLRDGERVRVFRMVGSVCVQEVWGRNSQSQIADSREETADSRSQIADSRGETANSQSQIANSRGGADGWVLEERNGLMRDGAGLPFVPFVFHGPRGSRPEVERLPLRDIIAANLDHYRLDADYKHGLHFTALPTAWVSGFDKASPLRIGSSTAWVSEVPGASAGFLEFSGTGLAHLERALEKVERRMALLGARMLEGGDTDGNGAGGSGQLCGLGSIVASLNQSLTGVLGLATWWLEGGHLEEAVGRVSFAMNTDLGARALSGEEITAVVAAWRAGAISRETMLERLKRGEVLPDGRSVAQERGLIHGRGN
jgi:hypothetical protein